MDDAHVIAITTIVQDVLLGLNLFLIAWSLLETYRIRKAAEAQATKCHESELD
jgi:hypothetical protein